MSKINYTNKVALNVDPSIAAINKCQADDMNSIKNAINQNGSYTPLTINTDTGVFYCTLEGTLAANDIVNVNVPSTIGNVSWSVSVDGDTTSYTVLYEDGSNVKPVDVSQQNVSLYFNGTNFILKKLKIDDVYSTTETKTNKVWTDGKPIYRLVADLGSAVNIGANSWRTTGVNVNDLKMFISCDATVESGATSVIRATIVNTNVLSIMNPFSNFDISVRYIIIEYTKTTD